MSSSNPPPTFLMRMGCTKELITFRAGGNEGVCLQSPSHGIQRLANFSPAAGDFIGVDDILERTLAHDNLSDITNYITAVATSQGTELYVDMTGTGQLGTPFALLEGVTTTLAQLVADGGIRYVPDAIAVAPQFNTPFTYRPDGLETALLGRIMPGVAPQVLNGFTGADGCKLELNNILAYTNALPNMSNIANYITATDTGGNTILSFDHTGAGQTGTPFAVLTGVTETLAQLLSQNALVFDPTRLQVNVSAGANFTCRAVGEETVSLQPVLGNAAAAQIANFSVSADDGLDVTKILSQANIQADVTNINSYFSTVETGGNTQLWFNPDGGSGGTLEAVFQNTNFSINDLLAHSALTTGS